MATAVTATPADGGGISAASTCLWRQAAVAISYAASARAAAAVPAEFSIHSPPLTQFVAMSGTAVAAASVAAARPSCPLAADANAATMLLPVLCDWSLDSSHPPTLSLVDDETPPSWVDTSV